MWSWGKKQYGEKILPEDKDKKSWLFLSEIENSLAFSIAAVGIMLYLFSYSIIAKVTAQTIFGSAAKSGSTYQRDLYPLANVLSCSSVAFGEWFHCRNNKLFHSSL